MGRPCSICTHPARSEIDRALVDGSASMREIARRYRVGADSLRRHRKHIAATIAEAEQARREAAAKVAEEIVQEAAEQGRARTLDAGELLARLERLANEAEELFKRARNGRVSEAALALREARVALMTLTQAVLAAREAGSGLYPDLSDVPPDVLDMVRDTVELARERGADPGEELRGAELCVLVGVSEGDPGQEGRLAWVPVAELLPSPWIMSIQGDTDDDPAGCEDLLRRGAQRILVTDEPPEAAPNPRERTRKAARALGSGSGLPS